MMIRWNLGIEYQKDSKDSQIYSKTTSMEIEFEAFLLLGVKVQNNEPRERLG